MRDYKNKIICPYCEHDNGAQTFDMIKFGTLNYYDTYKYALTCKNCGKTFDCFMKMELLFKTCKF